MAEAQQSPPAWVPQWLRELSDWTTRGTQASMQDISDTTQRINLGGGRHLPPMTSEDFNVLLSLGTAGSTLKGPNRALLERLFPDRFGPAARPAAPPAFDINSFDPRTRTLRLYRGEGSAQVKGGDWFTTDRTKAAQYGTVHYLDVTPEDMAHAAQGHGGPDEVVFDNPSITARSRPLGPGM